MIALIIAAVVVGIIFLLLISSLKITFRLSETVVFYVTFLGVLIFDINAKPKRKKEKKQEEFLLRELLDF